MRARSWVLPLLMVSPVLACERVSARRPPVATEPIVHSTTVPIASTPAAPGEPESAPGGAVVGSGPTNLWRDSGVSAAPEATPQDGPSPVPFAVDVRLATDVVLYDTWNGLGATHTVAVALHKSGAFYTYDAKVSASPFSVGEPIPDPRMSPTSQGAACRCALTSACGCETDAGATRKQGRVPLAAVAELLTAFGTRPLDLRQVHPNVGGWSDDYPYRHFVVTVPGASPVHFTAPDQRRQWLRDGKFLYRLPDEMTNGSEPEHAGLNRAFANLESALGVGKWITEQHKIDPNGGPL